MTTMEAIKWRHSVRAYNQVPISSETVLSLRNEIAKANSEGDLHIQLILNESKAFAGPLARYGKFSGVSNYLVIAGKKSDTLGMRAGYYGEKLVLHAATLGLCSCWAGLSYKKIPDTFELAEDEKILCYISLGYADDPSGVRHRIRKVEEVSNGDENSPKWFIDGVKSALLAPTAVNQQKFFFRLHDDGYTVSAEKLFSIVGYTDIDLGIASLHFEVGAGMENFRWAKDMLHE